MNYRNIIPIIVFASIFLILLITENLFQPVDKFCDKVVKNIFGQKVPDTSIVLITITKNDIESLGEWPIKRSYYALLIQQIKKYSPKKIAFEIVLNKRSIGLNYYDDLLKSELEKMPEYVLGLMLSDTKILNDKIIAGNIDSLIINVDFNLNNVGHLFFYNDRTPIIPENIFYKENLVPSFSKSVSGVDFTENIHNINITSSKNLFFQIELLDFFAAVRDNSPILQQLKDKIIIVGVTDDRYAADIDSPFDESIAGIYLHAFAIDNLLTGNSFSPVSLIVKILILVVNILILYFIISRANNNSWKIILLLIPILFLAAGIIENYFNSLMPFSAIIFPWIVIGFLSIINEIKNQYGLLQLTLSESELLKKLVTAKEERLAELQKELEAKGSDTLILKTKIASLNKELDSIKNTIPDDDIENIESYEGNSFEGMVYTSKEMKEIVSVINKISTSDETVLIIGESGTGKELVANAIHKTSKRKNNVFITVNCGALTESILESELFGHVKGSFTGAVNDKIGRFEAADKGTIFLDEIGEISENFQIKLLRVIQQGTFEKVGSSKTQKVDVRIIAATNKDLTKQVKEKKFREDLYYRLNIIKIEIPPLKKRKDDIPVLVNHFLKQQSKELTISTAVMNVLKSYEWSGNVRELESALKRASIFAQGENRNIIRLSDLPDEINSGVKFSYEEIILNSLREKNFSHSSFTETAKELGVNRTVIAEHFRGIAFKTILENNLDIKAAAIKISLSDSDEINKKVASKIELLIENIKEGMKGLEKESFEKIKEKLSSKYRNLPKKYHTYLDELITIISGSKIYH